VINASLDGWIILSTVLAGCYSYIEHIENYKAEQAMDSKDLLLTYAPLALGFIVWIFDPLDIDGK
jgi:hypothetical protein